MDNLREEIADILPRLFCEIECGKNQCVMPDPDKHCKKQLEYADIIINRLSELGYGKIVDSERYIQEKGKYFNNYTKIESKVFQPIERVK